jgi:DME family drug/metabolite transporter
MVGRRLRTLRAAPWRPLAVASVGVALYQVCFFAAVKRTGVAVGTVVALGSAPGFTGALAWLVTRARPSRVWCVATALAVAGASAIALAGGGAHVDAGGVGLAVFTGIAYAAFTLASKQLLDTGLGREVLMAGTFGIGAVLLLPLFVTGDAGWVTRPKPWLAVLWLGVMPTAVAYRLFARGLSRLSSATVTTLTLAEPAMAIVLAAIVLHERPGPLAVVGIVGVLAGLVVLALDRPDRSPSPGDEPDVAPPLA